MAVSRSVLVTLITSFLVFGALAVKEQNAILDGHKVKIVLEDGDIQSTAALLEYFKSLLSYLNIDISRFSLNPIGLILPLGTLPVNCAIGSLVHNGLAEYLPTFSSHTFAMTDIVQPLPGHTLYNITDKIQALDVAGWFSKFLATHDLGYISTTMTLKRRAPSKNAFSQRNRKDILAVLFALAILFILSEIGRVSKNGYLTINMLCILGLAINRCITTELLRCGLDKMVKAALPKKDEKNGNGSSMHDICKVWLTMPNGNAVKIFAPRGLIRCMLMTPQPASSKVYNIFRHISSILFGIQVLTLGMTGTSYQVVSLSIQALSTILLTSKTSLVSGGQTTTIIGNELELIAWNNEDASTHMNVYANMGLDEDEEESMRLWGLMPHATNKGWWSAYEKVKEEKMVASLIEDMD